MNGWQHLSKTDPEIAALVATEIRRERSTLELIASENFASRAVLEATGSVFTNKYAEGYPGRRYYGGCEPTDGVETLARDRVKALFGAEHANVQPHSGTQANMAVYIAACTPGDTIMGLDLAHGGHLTHGHPLNFSGKYFKVVAYGVRKSDELLDYEQMERLADENKPKLIVAGASAYSRQWDYERIAAIAKHVGARVMVDIAHVAGLIAAGLHPNPVPHADYVTTTTHKTLRGPRGGVVLCKEEHAKDIDRAVFPGGQGGPLVHVIAAKAVSFKEAKGEAFKKYQQQVIANAQTLAKALADGGHRIVTGGTDTHLFLVDVFSRGVTGKVAEEALEKASVTVNKNTIPFDQNKPLVASGIRIGTPAVTTRGMGETEMKEIAAIIGWVLDKPDDDSVADSARARVRRLCDEFPLYPDLEQMSAALLPVFLDLSGRLVVVTGTTPGSLAFALRACALGARVRLVGTGAGGHAVAGAESVDAVPTAAHLAGASLLVAGSASSEDDAAITAEADARGVTTIRLDGTGHAFAGEASGAGRVAVAATTRGASSELERRIAADAARSLRPEHERMADILATIRGKLEERFPDESLRSAIWEQILDSPVMVLLESGEDDAAAEMAERMAWGTG